MPKWNNAFCRWLIELATLSFVWRSGQFFECFATEFFSSLSQFLLSVRCYGCPGGDDYLQPPFHMYCAYERFFFNSNRSEFTCCSAFTMKKDLNWFFWLSCHRLPFVLLIFYTYQVYHTTKVVTAYPDLNNCLMSPKVTLFSSWKFGNCTSSLRTFLLIFATVLNALAAWSSRFFTTIQRRDSGTNLLLKKAMHVNLMCQKNLKCWKRNQRMKAY